MNFKLRQSLMAAAVSSLLVTPLAQATNGYFSDGTGAKNRGMGGAGVSLADETGNIVTNPASAVLMGERLDVGMGFFSPSPRTYSISGNDLGALGIGGGNGLDGADESGRDMFLIPFFGQTFSIDSNSSVAITGSALGGMNTDFKRNPFSPLGGIGNLGVDLKQATFGGTYARKVTPELSLGVTLSLVIQQFKAYGLGVFGAFGFSTDAANLSDKGNSRSTGIGLNLGAMYDLGNGMTLGFNYAPEVDMSEFDEYKGLFAQQGDFDIPSHYSLGFSMKATPVPLVGLRQQLQS
jgi:long-chain fatty acid transport protein